MSKVLFPNIGAVVDALWRVGSEEANAVDGLGRPTADVDHSPSLVRQSEGSRAEDIGLESELTVRVGLVVKLERTLGVIQRSTMLLDEDNLVIDAN